MLTDMGVGEARENKKIEISKIKPSLAGSGRNISGLESPLSVTGPVWASPCGIVLPPGARRWGW